MMTKSSLVAAFLNAEPAPIRDLIEFQFCVALVRTGQMDLCSIMPGDSGPVFVFRDNETGRQFRVTVPLVDSDN